MDDLVLPTLREWAERDLGASAPLRWAARFELLGTGPRAGGDEHAPLLHEALRRSPNDAWARHALVEQMLYVVGWNAHHLYESVHLGDVEDDLRLLSDAEAVAKGGVWEEWKHNLDFWRQVLTDFKTFRALGEDDFPAYRKRIGHREEGWF